jgi:hypothetical protein
VVKGSRVSALLIRQRDHAREHGQNDRAELFTIIKNVERPAP